MGGLNPPQVINGVFHKLNSINMNFDTVFVYSMLYLFPKNIFCIFISRNTSRTKWRACDDRSLTGGIILAALSTIAA